jgi:hypothetical protein
MGRFKEPLKIRFDRRVQKNPHGCWFWTGYITAFGYGNLTVNKRPEMAHHLSLLIYKNIPLETFRRNSGGKQVDHICRETRCVNPNHLEIVTPRENVLFSNNAAAKNAAKKECKRGHSFSGENLLINSQGYRQCRKCNYLRYKKHSEKTL